MHNRAAPCNPMRASRRGAARLDLIVMILMCVAVLGVATWAIFSYNAWDKDELVTSRLEAWVPVVEGEYHAAIAAMEQASRPLGYVGPTGGIASAGRIESELLAYGNERPLAYSAPSGGAGRDNSPAVTNGALVGVSQINNAYVGESAKLVSLIDAQDARINQLVTINGEWRNFLQRESEFLNTAIEEYLARLNTYTTTETPELISQNTTRLSDEIREYLSAATTEATSKTGVFAELNDSHEVISDARRALADERAKLGPAAEEARRVQELVTEAIAKEARRLAREGDFRGFVEQVDPDSGYVWISLGQSDNVRREMSFQVSAPTPDGTATVIVAEIRVKDVIGPHLSQCRIDFLRDDNVLPKPGDYVRNTAYSGQDYTIFAFAGNFGGKHSRYSRQQLTEMLQQNGRQVQTTPGDNVEVVIVGGDFTEDPHYRRLVEKGVRFERMTEREILYMYMITRPE